MLVNTITQATRTYWLRMTRAERHRFDAAIAAHVPFSRLPFNGIAEAIDALRLAGMTDCMIVRLCDHAMCDAFAATVAAE